MGKKGRGRAMISTFLYLELNPTFIVFCGHQIPKTPKHTLHFRHKTLTHIDPFGIALGIALSKTYKENSPSALITVGLLNASSAGLLIYMALVDLLAADFMGTKLQGSIKLQIKAYAAVLLGAGGMSLMAKWA